MKDVKEPAASVELARLATQPKPFRFYTSLVLQESTGMRAATLPVLAKLLPSYRETLEKTLNDPKAGSKVEEHQNAIAYFMGQESHALAADARADGGRAG